MIEKILTKEYKVYEYTQEEKESIIKDILDKRKSDLCFYWNYNDKLNNEQIINILLEEDGLNETINNIYEYNIDYISKQIHNIIKEELNEQQKTDEILKEQLYETLQDNYKFEIDYLINNSSINLRVTLMTNEDLIYLKEGFKNDTIKKFMKTFKGCYDKKELQEEYKNVMGSDYAHITFYFKVSGNSILRLREQIQKGQIILNKAKFGLFNYYVGAGSILECNIKKPITLNLKNWCNSKSSYYNVYICDDKKSYGIQETYNLSYWIEEYFKND